MKKRIFASVIGLVGFAAVLSPQVRAEVKEKYENLQVFAKVLNLVQEYYVEDVQPKKLIYGGIKGMLAELDPHTNFLPPDIFQEFETETSGEFGGLGIEITVEGGILTVLAPIEDTPAWKAGIKGGDKIVSINGESTKGLSLVEAAKRMKGKTGSAVRLGVFREGFDKPQEFKIVRDVIRVKSVKWTDLDDGYVYVRLTSFIEKTYGDLREVLDQIQKRNKSVRGLIIDLRNNPGGLLDQAVKISDLFIEEGVIVSTVGRNKTAKSVSYARKEGTLNGFPIVVVINEYSASASEILAGALQDHQRAVIMGQKSFGKGSVQSVVKLGDGSGLKLTVARYYTPNGRSIQAEGIKPDIAVDNIDSEVFKKAVIETRAKREKDIDGHLRGDNEESTSAESVWYLKSKDDKKKLSPREELISKDYQIMQAYNYLRAWDFFGQKKKREKESEKQKESAAP